MSLCIVDTKKLIGAFSDDDHSNSDVHVTSSTFEGKTTALRIFPVKLVYLLLFTR